MIDQIQADRPGDELHDHQTNPEDSDLQSPQNQAHVASAKRPST